MGKAIFVEGGKRYGCGTVEVIHVQRKKTKERKKKEEMNEKIRVCVEGDVTEEAGR